MQVHETDATRDAQKVSAGESSLDKAITRAREGARTWWTRARADTPWLLAVPDVGATCETLLADQLFHDLSREERSDMLSWVRAQQDESGAWLDAQGRPDLSTTALAWWARAQAGDDLDSEDMVTALRAVHELGGAQRASFNVRLWLALSGLVPWAWLPSIPSELWLLPQYSALSPGRISTWARGVLTPYHLLAGAPARLQLSDASALLLRGQDGSVIPPRLTRDGLAGDLLQAFDRAIKLSRKLPRGPVKRIGLARARSWVDEAQQEHGGWFSVRPTLLSLLALRVMGAPSDDDRIRRGLAYLRKARGTVAINGERQVAQGLTTFPLGLGSRLAQAADTERTSWLVSQEIGEAGPWQLRANAPAGGWPQEAGAQSHLDLHTTCMVLDSLRSAQLGGDSPMAWPSMRRASEVITAMQEPDGSFARFERGESTVLLSRFPWRDADQLSADDEDDTARVSLSASALRQLGELGRRLEDDRVRRGIAWIESRFDRSARTWSTRTLAEVGRCAAVQCPGGHGLRRSADERLRTRQREDGSFGSPVETASALIAMIELDGVCVQAKRAARNLVEQVRKAGDPTHLGSADLPGFGLTERLLDPSAGIREAELALRRFKAAGGEL
jgi:squalene cyclase